MSRLAMLTAVVLLTLCGVVVLWELREAVLLFLLSIVVAAAVRPVVDRLVQRRVPRMLALLGTYLVGLLAIGLLTAGTLWLLTQDLNHAGGDFGKLYHYVGQNWTRGDWLQKAVARRMPPPEEFLATVAGQHAGELFQMVVGTAFNVLGSLVDIIVIVILSMYWTSDRVHFERLWLSLLPLPWRTVSRDVFRAVEAEVGAYLRSEIVQSLIAGLVLGIGYRVLGLPYPALLAVVAALAWMIPWVGMVLALVTLGVLMTPTVVLGTTGDIVFVGLAALFTVAVFLFLEFLVEPRLFDRNRYNSLLMVFAVIALAGPFGILGLLLGPMLEVALQVFAEHLLRLRIAPPEPVPHLAGIDQRLAQLRSRVQTSRDLPPQLVNIVERLDRLVAEAREVTPT